MCVVHRRDFFIKINAAGDPNWKIQCRSSCTFQIDDLGRSHRDNEQGPRTVPCGISLQTSMFSKGYHQHDDYKDDRFLNTLPTQLHQIVIKRTISTPQIVYLVCDLYLMFQEQENFRVKYSKYICCLQLAFKLVTLYLFRMRIPLSNV